MIADVEKETQSRMQQAVDHAREDLSTIRTGRAHLDILYDILPLRRRTVIISGYLVLLVLSFLFEIAVAAMMLAMPMAGVNVGADWPVAVL